MNERNGRGPSAVIAERLARCRRKLKACGAGAFLISNHADYFYLTGFTGDESAVIITPREVHLITDGRFTEEIKHEVPWARSWLRRGFLNDEIVKACAELKIRKLAVQPGHLTVGDHVELKKRNKATRLIIAPPIVDTMRRLKDDGEIAVLRKAIRVAEDGYAAMLSTIRVGQTELEMAARLEYEMKRRAC